MERWDLKIELRSDLCTATGEDAPGMINRKTALEGGIPYIPAKRIKGCLLEAGREMADNGVIEEEMLYHIFGRPGMGRGEGIRISDGHLNSFPGYLLDCEQEGQVPVGDYDTFLRAVRGQKDVKESLLEDIFTRTRTRTAIEEETNAAKQHSLRTIQTVPSGIVFSSRIEGCLGSEEEKALRLCVKGLRHMGIGITRGMGEVRCTLVKARDRGAGTKDEKNGLFADVSPEDEVVLSYEVFLEQPVLITGDAGDGIGQIPGSTVMGALAGLFIEQRSLGENAHEDEEFSRIFLRDGVQFGNAFLRKGGKRFVPCPKAFARPKDDGTSWFNVMEDGGDKRRKNISGQVSLQTGILHEAAPQKEIHFHHARPADRAIGHAQNDRAEDTSVPTGQFFQYIALSKGQTFAGAWRGREGDIRSLVECLGRRPHHLMLGRSRTAEYGRCEISITGIKPVQKQEGASTRAREWLVWLLSPLVYRNQQNGAYEAGADSLRRQMEEEIGGGIKIEFVDSVCGHTVFSGYNSRWRLPLATCPALSAGSSFHLISDRDVEAWMIEGRRWGMLTGKGCGEVKAEPWSECHGGRIIAASGPDQSANPDGDGSSCEGHGLADIIVGYQKKRLNWREADKKALGAVDKNGGCLPSASDISLLIQLLKGRDGSPGNYAKLEQEVRRIKGEEKQNNLIQFIKPCEKEPDRFMRQYLEAAKWKARRREETNG